MSRKKKKGHGVDESWLLPYSDMLTLLLALFIVLFAASEVDSQKYERLAEVFRGELMAGGPGILEENVPPSQGDIPEEEEAKPPEEQQEQSEIPEQEKSDKPPLEEIKESMDAYILENQLDGKFETKLTREGLMLTIVDDVFFDKGSAEVKEEARRTAEEVAQLLYSDPPHEVVVSGHTDNIPISTSIYASNWELSVERAVNFMTVVLDNENLDPTLFSAKGYGEYQPAVPNTTAENRQKNRRVEILVLPNEGLE